MKMARCMGLATALLAGCQTGPYDSRAMDVGPATLPPSGFVEFCRTNADACEVDDRRADPALTAARWSQLVGVNDEVNHSIPYRDDSTMYGRQERWAYPVSAGDCEDLALEKRRRLVDLGWPPRSLLIALARGPGVGGHAVLVAVTEKGDYVLDVRTPYVHAWDRLGYAWLKRQSREDPMVWVTIGT